MMNQQKPPLIPDRIKAKIVETVSLSKLTIIVGPTGSGKSTLIPPLLLDELNGRILCSQPRRLAVVAISKRVAEERGVTLGGKHVGYHVGNHNLSTRKTQLLFTTAGILLEELRNNGVEALTKFKCVIIDECHERSPESDLVLALIKQFMQAHPREEIHLVLMSATFDHRRYASYFRDVPGCSTIDTITLETAESFQAWHNQVSTYYLDDLPLPESILGMHKEFIRRMRLDPNSDLHNEGGKTLSDGMLSLIRSLIAWLDEQEPEHAPFLIFVPTYRHLEQIYNTLVYVNGSVFELSVLHSAVDIEDCIRTMTSRKHMGRRRVLLASAIADSSVTVPGVSCVVDLCRALEVRWDVDSRSYAPKTVWCSKSIAEQRKGRTGRTCRGRVFRLVHQGFYIQHLLQWDVPQLTMSACHNEVLAMVCADDKLSIDDPRMFFAKCLDPPPSDVVEDAIDFLVEIDACQKVKNVFDFMNRGATEKIAPSDYGMLVSSLSMSVAEARIVLEGGRLGLLHEILAFMAIYNHRPAPIIHVFGDVDKNQEILQSFYDDVEPSSPPSVAIANLSAYIYWDAHWNHERSRRNMKTFRSVTQSEHFSNGNGDLRSRDTWKWTAETELAHIEWCKENDLNPTSMRSVSDIIETTMNVLFLSKHEPEWLRCSDSTPRWKRRSEWEREGRFDREMLPLVYGDDTARVLCDVLTKLVSSRSALASRSLAETFLGVPATRRNTLRRNRNAENVPMACIHFLAGNCMFKDNCRHSHSRHARRPSCRFFLSGRCSKGDACIYSHEDPDVDETISGIQYGPTDPLVPVVESLHLSEGALGWFKSKSNQLFLLGEGNFQFTRALTAMGTPPLVSSSNLPSSERTPGALIGVDATMLHLNPNVAQFVRMARDLRFAWNFPFTGAEEDAMEHEALILQSFQSLYLLFEQHGSSKILLGIALQGDQFSRWNVTRSAWRTGWSLISWSDFDHKIFPGYHPSRQNGETFPVESAKLYVFEVKKLFS